MARLLQTHSLGKEVKIEVFSNNNEDDVVVGECHVTGDLRSVAYFDLTRFSGRLAVQIVVDDAAEKVPAASSSAKKVALAKGLVASTLKKGGSTRRPRASSVPKELSWSSDVDEVKKQPDTSMANKDDNDNDEESLPHYSRATTSSLSPPPPPSPPQSRAATTSSLSPPPPPPSPPQSRAMTSLSPSPPPPVPRPDDRCSVSVMSGVGSHGARSSFLEYLRSRVPEVSVARFRQTKQEVQKSMFGGAEEDLLVKDSKSTSSPWKKQIDTIDENASLDLSRSFSFAEVAATRLHDACAEPDATLPALQEVLASRPESVSIKDSKGRLPLHIIGDNAVLLSTEQGRKVAGEFCRQLMRLYPKAITTADDSGHVPFAMVIEDWVLWVYHTHQKLKLDKGKSTFTLNSSREGSSTRPKLKTLTDVSTALFPRAVLWDEVDWSFSMLSFAMDELGRPTGRAMSAYRRYQRKQARRLLATQLIETVPNLLKTILVVEDFGDDVRNRLLRMSILRRVLLCPESVGPWLTKMLHKKGSPASKAVDYLQIVSTTTVEDLVGHNWTIREDDVEDFVKERLSVFDAVAELEGILASLIILHVKEIERAAATKVIVHVANEKLGSHIVVALAIIDFTLHIVLLESYRTHITLNGGDFGPVPYTMVFVVATHYFIRFACEAKAMSDVSTTVLWHYLQSPWTLLDIVAIILAVASSAWMLRHQGQYLNGMNSLVVGLLWLKVLSFLKVVNKDLSTFILALFQILIDLKYFLGVLIIVVIMFADMLHVAVSTEDNGNWCVQNEPNLSSPALDFCYSDMGTMLRVYALIAGDVSLDDWGQTPAMVVFFIFITLFAVIILLNVLIAVISDSYEKARISSLLLFGRARVFFVARQRRVASYFLPEAEPIPNQSGLILRRFVLMALVASAMAADGYLIFKLIHMSYENANDFMWMILACFFAFLLTTSLLGMIAYLMICWIRYCSPDWQLPILEWVHKHLSAFLRLIASYIFGLRTSKGTESDEFLYAQHAQTKEEELLGRIATLQKTVEETKDDLKDEMSHVRMIYDGDGNIAGGSGMNGEINYKDIERRVEGQSIASDSGSLIVNDERIAVEMNDNTDNRISNKETYAEHQIVEHDESGDQRIDYESSASVVERGHTPVSNEMEDENSQTA